MNNHRACGGGQQMGAVYILSEADNDRFGSHWFKGRVRDGDTVLCVAHTGDAFYNYKLLHVYANALELESDSPSMCGYCLGRPAIGELTAREYHLLMAGENVQMEPARIMLFTTPKEESTP